MKHIFLIHGLVIKLASIDGGMFVMNNKYKNL